MAKKTTSEKQDTERKSHPEKSDRESNSKTEKSKGDGFRETVDSIVVAFILAFMFRAFLAEALVIPTGSMAPTLYGRHKQVTCSECGYSFPVGASDEVDDTSVYLIPENRMQTAICPNCRYEMPKDIVENLPVFTGDRILVNKFPYEFGNPKRWDVVVFKYPEEPNKNYIKRLVGLPEETISLKQGDVYVKTDTGFRMVRKDDLKKQNELQLLVYDENHPPKALHKAGWPQSWAAVVKNNAPGSIAGWSETTQGWQQDLEKRSFSLEATDNTKWLRYRHFVPNREAWNQQKKGNRFSNVEPQLIMDYCGYNAYTPKPKRQENETYEERRYFDPGYYWVGDLTVSCRVKIDSSKDGSLLTLELNEGWRRYRCDIDVSTGMAVLKMNIVQNRKEEEWLELGSAETSLISKGKHDLSFANVDNRLVLWVDGDRIDFGKDENGHEKAVYLPYAGKEGWQQPVEADLIPVGIAAKGLSIAVSNLMLTRDIYYRNEFTHPDDEFKSDSERPQSIPEYQNYPSLYEVLDSLKHQPIAWFDEYFDHLSIRKPEYRNRKKFSFSFTMDKDEFFMMGDNSPRSKDSRLWNNTRRAKHRHAVPRYALVGEAFFIYWPHGVPFLNGGKGFAITHHKTFDGSKTETSDYPRFRLPFYPNFSRMKRIR